MKFLYYFVTLSILSFYCSPVFSQKCLTTFNRAQDLVIKELNVFNSIPLTEKQIIKRVLSGEDIRLLDLNQIRKNYQSLQASFSGFDIHLAYKAFSSTHALDVLNKEFNAKFEIATLEEFKKLQKSGVSSENIIFTHPDKDALEISSTFKGGVKTFVSDSEGDLLLLSKHAPKSKVLIRIAPEVSEKQANASAGLENFDERFGVSFQIAKQLILIAQKLNLTPVGLSFHVGSQTEDPKIWTKPIKQAADLFKDMKKIGIDLKVLNIGGGFPMRYSEDIPKLDQFGKDIKKILFDSFGRDIPETLIIEPGRFVSASAGVIIGRVVSKKASRWHDNESIVTVSTGRYSAGIVETGYGFYFYSVNKKKNNPTCFYFKNNFVLGNIYGKACASIDKLNVTKHPIPVDLKSGDLIVITGAGAYTGEIATPNWCGKKSPTNIIFDSKTSRLIYSGKMAC